MDENNKKILILTLMALFLPMLFALILVVITFLGVEYFLNQKINTVTMIFLAFLYISIFPLFKVKKVLEIYKPKRLKTYFIIINFLIIVSALFVITTFPVVIYWILAQIRN